jgi:hypothetical protein
MSILATIPLLVAAAYIADRVVKSYRGGGAPIEVFFGGILVASLAIPLLVVWS